MLVAPSKTVYLLFSFWTINYAEYQGCKKSGSQSGFDVGLFESLNLNHKNLLLTAVDFQTLLPAAATLIMKQLI